MRWTVEGADAKTGETVAISVEAPSAEEAERQARYNGMLIAEVRPSGARPAGSAAPVMEYRGVAEVRPRVAELAAAAARVRGMARVVRVLGIASLIGAVVLVVRVVYETFVLSSAFSRGRTHVHDVILAVVTAAFIPVSFGIFCLAAAAVLRLVAARSDAWREREFPPNRS